MKDQGNILFNLQDVTKIYGNTVALDSISLNIKSGCVISIYGPNGAGKSTLVKLLCGVENASSGHIKYQNAKLEFKGKTDVLKAGISYMPQDFGLISNLTGWENIKVSQNQLNKRFWFEKGNTYVDESEIRDILEIDHSYFDQIVSDLTNYQKQILAIYKALLFHSNVYIFDESTTDLNSEDFGKFSKLLLKLKERGNSILFISHKIEEVFSISDELIVLRNGELASHQPIQEVNKDEIIRFFISGDSRIRYEPNNNEEEPLIHINNTFIENLNMDFEIRKGEILHIATGDSALDQKIGYGFFDWLNKYSKLKTGIIPSNRNTEGIFSNLSIRDNLLANAKQLKDGYFIKKEGISQLEGVAKKLELKYENWNQSINELSGGNQQKVVLGRWLIADFDILVLIEPTSGIDLAAKAIVHNTILEMKTRGKSFILVTSDEGEKIKLKAKNIRVSELC